MNFNAGLAIVLVGFVVVIIAVVVVPGLTWYARTKEWVKTPDNLRHTTLSLLAAIWLMLGAALGNEGVDDSNNMIAMGVIAVASDSTAVLLTDRVARYSLSPIVITLR